MKKWKKVTIICICVIVGIVFLFRYVADLGMWSGTSFDTYKEKAYRGQFCDELPDDSNDFCFYCFNSGFGAYSMAAFTLDGKDYDDYIDGIPGKYSKANDEYGCTGKRVSETLKEMAMQVLNACEETEKFARTLGDTSERMQELVSNLRKQTGSVVEQGRSQKMVSDKAESAFLRVEDVADRLVHIAD